MILRIKDVKFSDRVLPLTNMLEQGKAILSSQPFSVFLGASLDVFEEGVAEISLDMRDELKQNYGFAHGGVISYLADNSITFAAASVFGDCVTSEYKVNYVRPAKGKKLVARAKILYSGKRQSTCECKIYSQEGGTEKLVAVSLGTINKISAG